MTVGALIYATDGDINYTKLAEHASLCVRKYLNIPTTIVNGDKTITGRRSWADCDTPVLWRNNGRCNALDDSPYDKTLLIDADYLVFGDCLSQILSLNGHFYAHNTRMYINEKVPKTERFGNLNTPMWWATVCVFDRSQYTRDVFDAWKMIEKNWQHYAQLFQFKQSPFRNDYALSLALLLVNGGEYPCTAIPWPLINVPDSCSITFEKHWEIEYTAHENKQQKLKQISVQDQDLHLMGKRNLEKIIDLC